MNVNDYINDIRKSNLSPEEKEKLKTERKKAQDISYTINHAIVCGTADFLTVPILAFTEKKAKEALNNPDYKLPKFFRWLAFGHDIHSHGNFLQTAKHWAQGEAIGDLGGVMLTVGAQRFAPGFMEKINSGLEPVSKILFSKGARKAAEIRARAKFTEKGIKSSEEEIQEEARRTYEYERDHLAQAILWTGSSSVINVGAQTLFFRDSPSCDEHGHHSKKKTILGLAAVKGVTASAVFFVTVGGRAIFPNFAYDWDKFTSKYVFVPATRFVNDIFGIENKPDPHIHGASISAFQIEQKNLKN